MTLYQKTRARHKCRAPFRTTAQKRRSADIPRELHLGELLEEGVVLLEALLGLLEHRHRLLLADLLDQLLEMRRRSFASKGRLQSNGEAALKGPLVLEYTSVSMTRILMFLPEARTWSRPRYLYAQTDIFNIPADSASRRSCGRRNASCRCRFCRQRRYPIRSSCSVHLTTSQSA